MLEFDYIISELDYNGSAFRSLLFGIPEELRLWRPAPEKWCLHEIVVHLLDEEREDFRARIASVLEDPEQELVRINPEGWVKERDYMSKDYDETLKTFIEERKQSIAFLMKNQEGNWENSFEHNHFGPMSAKLFLHNWLAHDYLHIRQIMRYKYGFLKEKGGSDLEYAGNW